MITPAFKFVNSRDEDMRYINMPIQANNTAFIHCAFINCEIIAKDVQFEGCLIDCNTRISGDKIVITPLMRITQFKDNK